MPYRQEQTQGWRKPGGLANAAGNQNVSLEEEAAELGLNRELPGNQSTGHVGGQGTLQGGGSAGVKERDGSGGWRVVGGEDGSFRRGHLEGLPSPVPGGCDPGILRAGSSASLIPVLGPQSTQQVFSKPVGRSGGRVRLAF